MKSWLKILFTLACLQTSSVKALESDLFNALQTVGGIYSSIYIHELGHAIAYRTLGATEISIKVPMKGKIFGGLTTATIPKDEFTQREALITSAAGLVAANLAGEIVIQNPKMHSSAFAQSMLGTALVSNVRHVQTYYTQYVGKDGYTGNDLDHFESQGGNPHLFAVGLLAYSAWSLHRMNKQKIPLFFIHLNF